MEKKAITDFDNDAVVAQYDTYPLIHEALGKPALLEFIGLVDGLNVLDLGCGSGHLTAALHKRGAKIIGVDVSECFVQMASSRHPELEFEVANGSKLEFIEDASMDLIVMSMVILGIPTREELEGVFAESARTLKPSGKIVFSSIHPLNMHRFKDGFRQINLPSDWNYFKSGITWEISVLLSDLESTMTFVDAHWSLEDISKALLKAGLVIEELHEPKIDPESKHFEKLKDELTVPYYLFFRACKK